MDPNHKIIPANLVKRTIAGLIDFGLNFLITMSLFAFVALPISNQFFSGNELASQIVEVQIESHLFTLNDETGRVETLGDDAVPEALYRYYMETEISPTFDSEEIETYYIEILGKNLSGNPLDFTKPISSFTPWDIAKKTSISDDAVDQYYRDVYQKAIADFQLSEAYQTYADPLNVLTTIDLLICLAIGSLLVYVLVPAFMQNGKTFGKVVVKIGVVNFLGYRSNKPQFLLRGISSVLVHYVGVIVALPFISYLWMIFSKKKQNLVDLLAGTLVVDEVDTVIYQNAQEQENYEKDLINRLEEVEQKRKKVVEEEDAKKDRPGSNF